MRLKILFASICCFIGVNAMFAQTADFMTNVYGRDYTSLNGKWSVIVDPYDVGEFMQKIYLDGQPREGGLSAEGSGVQMDSLGGALTRAPEYSFEGGPRLNVPGDWNSQMPELKYYEGSVWYAKHFNVEKKDGKRLFLYFGAVSIRCNVYLNGEKLGSHEGAFTPFQFEVTDKLKDGENILILKVNNNRSADSVPGVMTDWWNYGGITRDVMLIETPDVFINDYFVRLSAENMTSVDVTVKLSSPVTEDVKVEIPLLNISKTVKTNEKGEAELNIEAENIRLWSPDDPYLYNVTLSCGKDKVKEEIGFRRVEVRGTEILINGVPTFLRGVNFHEEVASRRARAVNEGDAQMLLSEVKALGANMVRLAHYPQNEYTVRLADKMGIILWEEIPVFGFIDFKNEEIKGKCLKLLAEMIGRDKNRCAICLFSISNETISSPERNECLTELLEFGKSLDSSRLFTSAFANAFRYDKETGKCFMDDEFLEKLDVVGINAYFGWYMAWPVEPSKMFWAIAPDKPIIMSEFGAEALYGQHGPAEKPAEWSEEFQAKVYREDIEMFTNCIPNLVGTCPWALFDFQTPVRMNQVNQMGWNRKGLVSDNGFRKQAWYVMHDWYESIKNKTK